VNAMKISVRKGFSFGLTTAIITTLALIVGLNASAGSVAIMLSGILIIAIADALSDSLGMHISEEASEKTSKEVRESTLATFFAKFLVGATFVVPILTLPLQTAVYASIAWGLLLITVLSYFIAKRDRKNPVWTIGEHVGLTVFIIFLTHNIGHWISSVFG
jgi:VIT1/CCC1 family predicted Fe2+/Mn2+ transporter